MKSISVDVAVIGAGTAGMTALRAARSHGKEVVLIEGGQFGTTCARIGCMPSKLLIAAADAAHTVREAPAFGVRTSPPDIDGVAVMARVRSERDRFVRFVLDSIDELPASMRLLGHARFIDAQTLQVDDSTIVNARSIVIATGSRPAIPAMLRDLGERILTNEEVFELQTLPRAVAVIGAGVIGLELGQALHRLGVKVTILNRNQKIGILHDPAIQDAATCILQNELDIRFNTTITGARPVDGGIILESHDSEGKAHTERFDYVLATTGRIPNLDQLNLEKTGLALDERGIPLFDPHTMRCGDSSIFIAGDANADRPVLHEAADQGRIAGDNAGRYPDIHSGLRHVPLAVVFSDPQIAAAGRAFDSLQANSFVTGEVSFDDQGRSRVMRQNHGLLHVYAERGTGKLLGAEMIGPRAEHLAHLLAWACQAGMNLQQMLEMPYYHPVVEEGLRTALRDAKEKLLNGLPEIEHCADCTPGL